MAESPLGPLTRIASRLRSTAKTVGLQMRGFTVTPDLDDERGPHNAQAVFTLDENFTPEPPKDDEWEKFEEEQAKNAAVERAEQARIDLADLAKNLERGTDAGIL